MRYGIPYNFSIAIMHSTSIWGHNRTGFINWKKARKLVNVVLRFEYVAYRRGTEKKHTYQKRDTHTQTDTVTFPMP